MKKIADYALAYGMWIIDIGLALWLCYLIRGGILDLFIKSFKPGAWAYQQRMNMTDRVVVIVLGLSWLAMMIFTEQYFRQGIRKGVLLRRIAKVTGPILLAIFVVDIFRLWMSGSAGGSWLRWLALGIEVIAGIGLLVYAKTRSAPQLH
jgi:hypothetical protein